MILVDQDGFLSVLVVQGRVIHDGIDDSVVDVFAVFVYLADGRPNHVVFVH